MGRPDATKESQEGPDHPFPYHLHTILPMCCDIQFAHVGNASDEHPCAPGGARTAHQRRK
eukprot:11175268-Lingulodinium_polyedra.AAC.2